ncbi:MAG: hypothetical protein IT342_26405 [Candidatus Melainabacteria bacterium]|nr:hypothetical protein [Candidatus Melainabacteria bacterium]
MGNSKSTIQLGELIVASGLASEEQLNLGLLGTVETGLPLGLQLILQNILDFDCLHGLVTAQSLVRDEYVTRETAAKAVALAKRKAIALNLALDLLGIYVDNPMKNRLGSLLVDGDIVDRAVLKSRLKVSRATCLPLGKVFIAGGDLETAIIDKAIHVQKLLRTGEMEREEAIDSIISSKSSIQAAHKTEEGLEILKTRLGTLFVQVGLVSFEDVERAAEEANRMQVRIGEALLAMHFISSESLDIVLEVQRLVRAKRFSREHGIAMLRRIHATDTFPCTSADGQKEHAPISFLNFLRLARLVDASGRNILSQTGVYRSHGVSGMIEDTWNVFTQSFEEDRVMKEIIPRDVAECLSENGFITLEQQLSVARAAKEYKMHRDRISNIEQALVKYHAAILDGKAISSWSGTFPAITSWTEKDAR